MPGYGKPDLDLIRELQAEPSRGFRETDPSGVAHRFVILGRGEMAFYQQGDRALLFEILAGRGVIFAKSIRRWDDGKKVTPEELEVILEVVARAMSRGGTEPVEIVRY